jgi:hypothetical protein
MCFVRVFFFSLSLYISERTYVLCGCYSTGMVHITNDVILYSILFLDRGQPPKPPTTGRLRAFSRAKIQKNLTRDDALQLH